MTYEHIDKDTLQKNLSIADVPEHLHNTDKQPGSLNKESMPAVNVEQAERAAQCTYEDIQRHLDYASNVLSPTTFNIYVQFVSAYCTPLSFHALHKKSQETGYDYSALLGRIFDLFSSFNKEQQEFILLRALEVAANYVCSDKIQNILSQLSENKSMGVFYWAELLRLLEPFIVQSAREVTQREIDDSKVKSYLGAYGALITAALHDVDKLHSEASKLLHGDSKQ